MDADASMPVTAPVALSCLVAVIANVPVPQPMSSTSLPGFRLANRAMLSRTGCPFSQRAGGTLLGRHMTEARVRRYNHRDDRAQDDKCA
jgi:hypothetical protein